MTTTLNRPQRSARKAKGHGHMRRAEILKAAEQIFVAEGYEGATIRKIADEVGVSSTCLYMHFRDKDQILLEIVTAAMEELSELSSQVVGLPLSPVERVRMLLRGYINFALRNPNAYRLVFCSPMSEGQPEKTAAMHELGSECSERFLGVVREIAAEGRLKAGDPQAVHHALWAACHGLATLMIMKPSLDWAPAEEMSNLLVDGLLFGLITD
ncbi:MAG: TetR/AcrR family transcriptional regulator [Caulobacteraceae bacterium]|nr:TetR/AcrR family transcriptional regulator [Caulobacteraceae bacterium]